MNPMFDECPEYLQGLWGIGGDLDSSCFAAPSPATRTPLSDRSFTWTWCFIPNSQNNPWRIFPEFMHARKFVRCVVFAARESRVLSVLRNIGRMMKPASRTRLVSHTGETRSAQAENRTIFSVSEVSISPKILKFKLQKTLI